MWIVDGTQREILTPWVNRCKFQCIISQYVVEEANEEEGEGQAAAKEGEAHTVGVETNLNEDKGNDGASQNQQEGKVFVGGISWQTTEESLQYYFQRFGEVADVVLMRDKITGNPRYDRIDCIYGCHSPLLCLTSSALHRPENSPTWPPQRIWLCSFFRPQCC